MVQTLFAFRYFPSRGRFEAVHWISLDSSINILEVARKQFTRRLIWRIAAATFREYNFCPGVESATLFAQTEKLRMTVTKVFAGLSETRRGGV